MYKSNSFPSFCTPSVHCWFFLSFLVHNICCSPINDFILLTCVLGSVSWGFSFCAFIQPTFPCLFFSVFTLRNVILRSHCRGEERDFPFLIHLFPSSLLFHSLDSFPVPPLPPFLLPLHGFFSIFEHLQFRFKTFIGRLFWVHLILALEKLYFNNTLKCNVLFCTISYLKCFLKMTFVSSIIVPDYSLLWFLYDWPVCREKPKKFYVCGNMSSSVYTSASVWWSVSQTGFREIRAMFS